MSIEPAWWTALRHGGLLLSPPQVANLATTDLAPLSLATAGRLRGALQRHQDRPDDATLQSSLLDAVLHDVCDLCTTHQTRWQRGADVEPRFSRRALSGEMVKPRRVWLGPNGSVLPVFVDGESRLGIGRGRRSVARVVEWCRGTGHALALVTNHRQFRLVHVAAEHEAWCEADTVLWLEGGQPTPQVEAMRRLLSPALLLVPSPQDTAPLLAAIHLSRQGQSQLTSILGERVRQAVEVLIRAHTPYLVRSADLERADVYRAATLMVMRLVVALFAEARDLFPRSNAIYENSYGLQGLWEKLTRAAGGRPARLRTRFGAWPQVLALFRLIHAGSHHPDLPLRAYGGELFRPGTSDDPSGVRRAMHLFEQASYIGDPPVMSDAEVQSVLDLLTRCSMPVRQGRSVTRVTVPVNFADISTEYIGILYEGLLDYELHQVDPAGDDPVVFLNIGDQPALPLSRLISLRGTHLNAFFKEFSKAKGSSLSSGSEEDDPSGDDADESPEESDVSSDEGEEPAESGEDVDEDGVLLAAESTMDDAFTQRERVYSWAREAVVAAQKVKATRRRAGAANREAEERILQAARQLVARIILPGDFYLTRWGGTRKGQGSFYTRPGLVSPTVLRTLAPLCYDLPAEPTLEELRDPAHPKTPGVILDLKLCDPATGSGSFPVSALRYLTNALWRSLLHHQWLVADDTTFRPGPALADAEPAWFRECVRDLPGDLAAAESTIRARLKRLVVERCLYGVDLDPLAIELARLSLWIETMDRDLPFGFLDHKFKCGNGLVGAWFDRFQDFPALCLHRPGDDAGDKKHDTSVHLEKEARSKILKEFRDRTLKPSLANWIDAQDPLAFPWLQAGTTLQDLHAGAVRLFEELHALPLHESESRAVFYQERVEPALGPVRRACDLWCALWFWPIEELDAFPLPIAPDGTPEDQVNTFIRPSSDAQAIVERLRSEWRFFHWELEFPDVFTAPNSGFHAILGNPPWEVQKPNSKEWFSNQDPLYRTYGKQEALRRQRDLFTQAPAIEQEWMHYTGRFKSLSNWCANAGLPWGDPGDSSRGGNHWNLRRGDAGAMLHTLWRGNRSQRTGFADPSHPFVHQGSADLNTYKLFLEQMYALLRPGGRLGVIVPSNVYTDKGSTALRRLFLDQCRWEWLFGFENREKVFDIDSRFKFCPIILAKGGTTAAIRTAFMRRSLADWMEAERFALPYSREQVVQFSPKSLAILELRSRRDAEILTKMYANGVLLGDDSPDGWGLQYAREFDMTNDSKLFPPRPVWEAKGYRPDEYGHWLLGGWRPVTEAEAAVWFGQPEINDLSAEPWRIARSILRRPDHLVLSRDGRSCIATHDIEDVALPLYEGRMIDHFDFSAKGWVSGKGRSAVWRDIPWDAKVIEPQYLMGLASSMGTLDLKVSFLDIGSATNARSMFATAVCGAPCGNVAPVLRGMRHQPWKLMALLAYLNTFAYDFGVRMRLGGLHLNYFVIEETPLVPPRAHLPTLATLAQYSASLGLAHPGAAPHWHQSRDCLAQGLWYRNFALSPCERLRKRASLEALVASALGQSESDLAEILRGCDVPPNAHSRAEFPTQPDPKGFWRVDSDLDPELRLTVLAQVAFQDLQRMGLEAFLAQNDGEGWMLPETLRLADYGLGHDDRAGEPQPVASRLGPRFHAWQLEGTVEQSWEECARHAALIQSIRRHPAATPLPGNPSPSDQPSADSPRDLFGAPLQTDLFGNETPHPSSRRKKT